MTKTAKTAITARERFEMNEILVVWGERCHGFAGRQARDPDCVFDENGDLTADFEAFETTLEQRDAISNCGGSFMRSVRRVLETELRLLGVIEDEDK